MTCIGSLCDVEMARNQTCAMWIAIVKCPTYCMMSHRDTEIIVDEFWITQITPYDRQGSSFMTPNFFSKFDRGHP